MKLEHLDFPTKRIARQIADYEAAGLDPNFEIPQPFAANVEHFYNTTALSEAGIDALGLARQDDQVLGENIGNNLAQRIKAAVKKGTDLPDQGVVDAMVLAYDFTGARATSEEGMSTEERTVIGEIRKKLRKLISGGTFASLDAHGAHTTNPEEIAFNAVRIQTGPEAEGKDKDGKPKITPPCSVPLDNFNELVSAAYQGTSIELEDGNGNVATLDFSTEPLLSEHDQALNLTGVVELARREAARILERNRTKATPLVVDVQIA
jgi:hypothetical protein